MSTTYFIPKAERADLAQRLGEVPALCEELAVTKLRQDRIVRVGGGGHAPHDSSRTVFHGGADNALAALHNSLTSWVRHTMCEHRGLPYPDTATTTITAAAWLRKNISVVAMTPGTEEAHTDITYRLRQAYRAVDLPPPAPPRVITADEIARSNRQIATPSQIEVIAGRLGDLGRGLDRQRVYRLRRRGALRPLINLEKGVEPQLYVQPECFRLGDVLDAHYRHARRNRRGA
ncbi:hypothetical protein [Williamsia deligens]|uniref:Uncharacterized protein n=1 Tax=Williamsia deligens TaxID=321325 RepID=A0ABW3GC15_9NOCA|nr:hypothetical protein [Williamsia deligens]MCP2196299.1 hypothetical protein [Williamsia deligens]